MSFEEPDEETNHKLYNFDENNIDYPNEYLISKELVQSLTH